MRGGGPKEGPDDWENIGTKDAANTGASGLALPVKFCRRLDPGAIPAPRALANIRGIAAALAFSITNVGRGSCPRRHHQSSLDRAAGLHGCEVPPGEARMWAVIHAYAIAFVIVVLFLAVEEFEPNRRYAFVLKFLVLAWAQWQ